MILHIRCAKPVKGSITTRCSFFMVTEENKELFKVCYKEESGNYRMVKAEAPPEVLFNGA